MITVRALRYTANVRGWHRFACALGLTPAGPSSPELAEFDGDGILAIHGIDGHDAGLQSSHDDLQLLTDDLDVVVAAALSQGCVVEDLVMPRAGEMMKIVTPSGQQITASSGARRAHGALAIQPLWYEERGDVVRPLLAALGLRPRITSDTASWADFVADGGGGAAFHVGPGPRIVLAMEFRDDLDAFAARLEGAGYHPVVVDEAYNRTILVATPDGDRLWINAVQEDLYGFHREHQAN